MFSTLSGIFSPLLSSLFPLSLPSRSFHLSLFLYSNLLKVENTFTKLDYKYEYMVLQMSMSDTTYHQLDNLLVYFKLKNVFSHTTCVMSYKSLMRSRCVKNILSILFNVLKDFQSYMCHSAL